MYSTCMYIQDLHVLGIPCVIMMYRYNVMIMCIRLVKCLFQVYTYTTMSGLSYDSSVNNCTCYKSYTHRHDATSPAFDMKDYTSKTYSTWTESK